MRFSKQLPPLWTITFLLLLLLFSVVNAVPSRALASGDVKKDAQDSSASFPAPQESRTTSFIPALPNIFALLTPRSSNGSSTDCGSSGTSGGSSSGSGGSSSGSGSSSGDGDGDGDGDGGDGSGSGSSGSSGDGSSGSGSSGGGGEKMKRATECSSDAAVGRSRIGRTTLVGLAVIVGWMLAG